MKRDVALEMASRAGSRFATERKIAGPPIDAIAVARDTLGIEVKAMPSTATHGVSGMLLRSGNNFGILYATHIDNDGFQRFSVAHEIAHYVLDGHIDQVLPADGAHESRAGFSSRDRFELEADHFAASLLMPKPWFTEAIDRAGNGFSAINRLSSDFACSLEATAIRYAQLSEQPVAIVMSQGEEILYWFASETFKALPNITWIRKKDRLPTATPTYAFNSDEARILECTRWEQSSSVADWFGDGPDLELSEDVVGLGRYGKTLTVLFPADDWPDEEEDDQLGEFAPTFHRSRRR